MLESKGHLFVPVVVNASLPMGSSSLSSDDNVISPVNLLYLHYNRLSWLQWWQGKSPSGCCFANTDDRKWSAHQSQGMKAGKAHAEAMVWTNTMQHTTTKIASFSANQWSLLHISFSVYNVMSWGPEETQQQSRLHIAWLMSITMSLQTDQKEACEKHSNHVMANMEANGTCTVL